MTSTNSNYHKLNAAVFDQLRCPICGSQLTVRGEALECKSTTCLKKFPVVDGVPILINEQNSVFAIEDFVMSQKRSLDEPEASSRMRAVEQRIWNMLPTINRNLKGRENYAKFAKLITQLAGADRPQVLVIGAGPETGEGMESLVDAPAIQLVETDVAFGPTTALVCDAHDIPFSDEAFDAVIVQAVLEHVADPYRCVHEIYRVLRPNGLVYAETPFMQQVHMGPYDFTRFTHLGHRRLFRHFTEIESGIACGPGMALAWSYQYFLISFARSRMIRGVLKILALLTSFFLQYLDPYAAKTPAAYDAASGFYFIGSKTGGVLSDRELVSCYRGAVWAGKR